MLLQVENTKDGYVVSGVFVDQDGCGRWRKIMNFGGRQGDAIWACHSYLPRLDELELKQLASNYDKNVQYKVSGLQTVRAKEYK